MTNFERMRQRLLQRAGLAAPDRPPFAGLSFDQLKARCCNPRFLELMDNRLVMGYLRYGDAKRKLPPLYFLFHLDEEVISFMKTGNLEHLINAANYARLEFENSQHPKKHFHATDRT